MTNDLKQLARLVRYHILTSTTSAGSGHPTSSLSATDLMTVLMFGGFFKADLNKPEYINNDRLIFSKGHAAPLLYSLYAAAGKISDKEMMTLRKFGSRLEGHPTLDFPYTEAATGSLGQGLSVGVGMALNAKYLDRAPYRTFVLLGDSEMAEGSSWEAMQLAAYYKLTNLIGIIDVNRLGQRGETMHGHDVNDYVKKVEAFGWEVGLVDGHNAIEISAVFERAFRADKPFMIVAKTVKGKGVSFLEDKEGWHGKTLSKEQLTQALFELGQVDLKLKGEVALPEKIKILDARLKKKDVKLPMYQADQLVSTRKAYGNALVRLAERFRQMVVLDAETSNSTFAELFKKVQPDRFFEMFIAEQNMVGTAIGLARRGKIPFVSTFAAFLTRAADQIRMSQYSKANIKFVGSHAGVSIGEDGASQMALEDLSLFRSVRGSVVLYPSDAMQTEKLVECAVEHEGLVYIRTTRKDTPILYSAHETFKIGGSKVLRKSKNDVATVVAAGVTLHEALKAYELLKKKGILIRVIDLYSVKPLDIKTLKIALRETAQVIVVEDHYAEGGIGEAVAAALGAPVHSLAVRRMPRSGTPEQLLAYEEIDAEAITKVVKKYV